MSSYGLNSDRKLREVRVSRQRAAAAVKSCLLDLDHVKVPKPRQAELEHERQLLEQAYEVLLSPAALSPEDKRLIRERKQEARWLDDELGLSE